MTTQVGWQLALGVFSGLALGWLGHALGAYALSGSSVIMLACVIVFILSGWAWGVILCVAVLSFILWSRYGHRRKEALLQRLGGQARRDWRQTLAGLGWALAIVVVRRLAGGDEGILAAYVGALAATTAAIWATEVGVLGRERPRLLVSGARTMPDMPGAISGLGLVAALGGAWLIGFTGLLISWAPALWIDHSWDRVYQWLPLVGTAGGFGGYIVNVLLAGTAQRVYYCERCQRLSEDAVHLCGTQARPVRGWPWLNARGVAFVATVVGAAAATALLNWLAQTIL